MNEVRNRRKRRRGVIVSDRMSKTVVVAVERRVKHPQYGKVVRQITNHKVHDENEEFLVGDTVEIIETRPLSKTKRWRVLQRLSKGTDLGVSPADAIESTVESEVMSSSDSSTDPVATVETTEEAAEVEESTTEDIEASDPVATVETADDEASGLSEAEEEGK